MSVLVWDEIGKKTYETGVKKGVLYVQNSDGSYEKGVAWNGLSKVSEKPTGAESNAVYADDIKYLNLVSTEEFEATIEAYTYPEEFEKCDGIASPVKGVSIGQQRRSNFAFSYVTTVGNDTEGTDYGYKIHIVYGATASPSEKSYETINDSPEAISFSWEIKTTPVPVTGFKPTATFTIDSKKTDAEKLKKLEEKLYGSENGEPTVLMPDEIISLFKEESAGSDQNPDPNPDPDQNPTP